MSAIFFILGALFFIGMAVILVMIIKLQAKEEPMDYTIVDNFMPQYCGYSQGVLVDIDFGDKIDGVTFIPKDVDYVKRMKKKEKIEIKPVTIYVKKDKMIFLPRGTLSPERNRLIILPPTPEDFRKEFLETSFGKALAKLVEKMDAEETVIDIQRRRIEMEDELLRRTHGLDRVREYLQIDKELSKDLVKKIVDSKDTKKEFTPALYPGPNR